MSQNANQEALAGLDQLIAAAKARLTKNPDYIALAAFEKARAEIVGVGGLPSERPMTAAPVIYRSAEGIPKKVSQLAGAAAALEKAGHPLQTRVLMEGAREAGAIIGGDNPMVNFGSSLSKSDKFRSVKWQGEYAWWFTDRDIPSSRVRSIRSVEEAVE